MVLRKSGWNAFFVGMGCMLASQVYAAAPCDAPATLSDGWAIAPAGQTGFDSAGLCDVLKDFAASPANFHSLVVERHGQLVAEVYRTGKDKSIADFFTHITTFDANQRHDVRSISKSVVSLLWGVAQAQGKTPPLDTPVVDLLPELAELKGEGRSAITLAHLFTMSSGLDWRESGNYGALSNDEFGLYWRSSQAEYLFKRPMAAAPGSRFNYNGGGTAVLAQILSERVGMSLPEFARRYLFEPLGMTDWRWLSDYRGRPLAFAGLRLKPRDIARLGRLVLAQGVWQGKQVVPAAWLAESTRGQITTGDGLRYGYQWWSGTIEVQDKTRGWIGGIGNGGQRLYMVPELDMVMVLTAGEYDQPEIGHLGYQFFKRVAATVTE